MKPKQRELRVRVVRLARSPVGPTAGRLLDLDEVLRACFDLRPMLGRTDGLQRHRLERRLVDAVMRASAQVKQTGCTPRDRRVVRRDTRSGERQQRQRSLAHQPLAQPPLSEGAVLPLGGADPLDQPV